MALERRILTFSGHVQGVGFRFSACRAAEGHDVTGYVRNLPDGGVEIVIEGDRDEIQHFVDDVRSRMHGYIRKVSQQSAPHQNAFRGFGVRY